MSTESQGDGPLNAAQSPVGGSSSSSAGGPPQRRSDRGPRMRARTQRRARRNEENAGNAFLRETAIVVVTALVLSLVVKTFLLQAFFIPSESMESTLVKGDRVVVSKLTPGPFGLDRGDVVVFEDPGGWLDPPLPDQRGPVAKAVGSSLSFVGLLPPASGNHLIKRVIGIGGDRVICCDGEGRLTINGVSIDEPYIFDGDSPSDRPFDITVPNGYLWVMGDHRSRSEDSRFHTGNPGGGAVDVDLAVGKANVLVWPLSRFARLSTQGDVFDAVPNAVLP